MGKKIFLMTLVFASTTAFANTSESIKVSGASSLGAVMKPVAKGFDAANGIVVHVMDTGAGGGLKCGMSGECDVGLVTGKIKPEDAAKLKIYEVGWDGIAILTNKNVGIKNLSTAQIAGIFSGKIKNWKEVGGQSAEIKVFSRDPSRSTFKQMQDHFKITLVGEQLTGPHSAVINHLKRFPNSIGFTTLGGDRGTDAPTLVSIDGIEPNLENIQNGKYPLIRPMYLVTLPKISPKTEKFINYVLKNISASLEKEGYIPAKL